MMQRMHSMSRTGQACYGLSSMSGHQVPGLYSIITNTGPHSCSETKNGTGTFLYYSKEGVTQGDPLSMFAYGIDILQLSIRLLKAEFPAVEQPWYADDAGADGKFSEIRCFFSKLQEIGPNFGYYPEPTKSILVVLQHNLEATCVAFPDFNFTWAVLLVRILLFAPGFTGKPIIDRKQPWLVLPRLPPTSHKLPMQHIRACRSLCSKNDSLSRESQNGLVSSFETLNSFCPRPFYQPPTTLIANSPVSW